MSAVAPPARGEEREATDNRRDRRKDKRPELSDRARHEQRLGQRLVAPAVVIMLLVTAFPILRALYLSFYTYSLTSPEDRAFIGIDNYVTALTDGLFWRDIGVTVLYMVVTVAIELVIGFAFAMVMHRVVFARGIIRTSILIPYGIITVVSGFAWQFAFTYQNGFINGWLPGISDSFNWFGETTPAVIAIMVSEIWKTTPFMSLLLLAGLAQVSDDMIEAAKVDGATWWQRLWRVILPNMRAAIMVAVLFRALDAYRIFDNIFVMTSGAVGTESISFLVYRQTIEQFQLGMGSALSVLLFLSVLLVAFLIVKLFRVDLAKARGEG
ncbi:MULTISPECIES: carbohydrate ABC transporter permease [Nocardioides]|uniref:Sugar ABC transporter permease n=1 Tax=Nocardioides kribbensis TaxID=305517 RepID=A0ABV1NYN2_9ACTN|nr:MULTISPECIES: sugar ABC transporter permease [Nocardioides]MCM3514411.1 sugar ABC transporter permease [Nocardioides sp. P86]